jgi:hypothetical protein
MATGDTFAGVKRPGREADHSPPSKARLKQQNLNSALLHGMHRDYEGIKIRHVIIIIIIIIKYFENFKTLEYWHRVFESLG